MANLLTVTNEPSAKDVLMIVTAALTGSLASGVETLDLTTIQNLTGHNFDGFFENPSFGGIVNKNVNGYECELVAGTALNNWQLVFYTAPGTKAGSVTYASLGITTPENVVTLMFLRRLM